MSQPPTLETDRLTLKPFVDDHLDDLIRAIFADPEVMKTLPGDASTPSNQRTMALKWMELWNRNWQPHGYGGWAVCIRAASLGPQGRLIGFCGFEGPKIEGEGPEFGYGLARAYWGKGLVTEAAQACLDYVFRATDTPRVHAVTYRELNPGSVRVLEKLGLTYERDVDLYDSVKRGRGLLPLYAIDREAYHRRKQG